MSGRLFTLKLKRVVCVDETEHEGFWFIGGEGLANDHMLLNAIAVVENSSGVDREYRSRRFDLGDNYEDGREKTMDRAVAWTYVSDEERHPVAVNVGLFLIEEDYAKDMSKDTEEAFRTYAKVAKDAHGIGSLVFSAIPGKTGKIGSVASKVASIVEPLITKAIADMANDFFPVQDISLRIEDPSAELDREDERVVVRFTDTKIGGTYDLHFEWEVRRISGPDGTRPLFRWFSPYRGDNFTTSDPNWSGYVRHHRSGYRFSGMEGFVFKPGEAEPESDKLPLYSWWSPSRGDNFLTSDPNWGASTPRRNHGYYRYRMEGYIYKPNERRDDTRALLSWWNPERGDNFATTSPRWTPNSVRDLFEADGRIRSGVKTPVKGGYRLYRLEGWVPERV